ncbi:MAG: DUF302 domain-containing protein [Methyloligellaceae bacterium]
MRIALVFMFMLVSHAALANEYYVKKPSPYTVAETLDRLTNVLKKKGITIFARVDHAAGAKKVSKTLRPTALLIFGNPKLGTPLMQSSQLIGLDLPLKALAYKDEAGKVWLTYPMPGHLKAKYGISDKDPVFAKITGALGKLTDAALKP